MDNRQIERQAVEDYLAQCGPDTRIYIGCDSKRVKVGTRPFADYTLVVVIHVDGCKGAKIFGQVERIPLWDRTPEKPGYRLIQEAHKAADLWMSMEDILCGYHCELHLDLNKDLRFKSSSVVQEAIGYVRGVTQITPVLKPDAWAASFAADRWQGLKAA